ncbi:MAG TPA: hypothetical protein VI685_02470 [Candidatus Angelobacter sp.]
MQKKPLVYALFLGVLCAGLAVKIGLFFWQTGRANAEIKKTIEYRDQHRLDWMNEYLSLEPPQPRTSDQHPCVYESLNQQTTKPQLGKCRTGWSLFSDPVDQFEVDLRYGAFVLRQTDLFLSDGFPVPFTRAYTSLDWLDPNPVHAFGRNSNHTYDISPLGGKPLFSSLDIALEDGDFLHFERISRGKGYSDGLYRHSETSGRFYKAIIYWNGRGWTTKLADGSMIFFPDSYGAKKIADGAPIEIDDAAGNKLRLERDANRNLLQVRTPHEQSIRLLYDDQGRIARAEDDAGHWVAYSYNRDGMLTNVVYSSGKKRRYEYDGTNLTVIRDEEDNILLRNLYHYRQVVAQQFANGEVYEYSYQWSRNREYAQSATVRLPDGTQQTIQTGSSVPNYLRLLTRDSSEDEWQQPWRQ